MVTIFDEIIMQADHYCEHFHNLKFSKAIDLSQQLACKTCHIGKNYIWLCLAKNCGCLVCDRNKKDHIKMHLEQSKSKKSFHSIFINVLTAQIICIHCDIEIYDLDLLKSNNKNTAFQDPFPSRLKILPSLAQFESSKNLVMGQLENSEGHRKINRNLTGFFSNRNSHAINSALQFLMQFSLFRQIILNLKPLNKEIEKLVAIFVEAKQANFRAIHTDELVNILISEKPELAGYRRKDPFQHVLSIMAKVHELIRYYTLDYEDEDTDAWEFLGNPLTLSRPILNCPLFDNISTTLSLNYCCQKCKRELSVPFNLNFLKLSFPKKKRKAKEVEKQLAEHRFDSPMKNKKRRNSLLSFFIQQQQCPFTLPQLLIQFLKQPFNKDKICSSCKQPMLKVKNHFQDLPNYLILQVNRMGTDGNSVDETPLQFNEQPLDLGPFTADKSASCIYEFETAICVQNVCSYPVICKNKFNKQTYVFKNQLLNLLSAEKKKPNPYIFCYKRKIETRQQVKLKDCYHNIKSNIQIEQAQQGKGMFLPDFWLSQLKNYIAVPLKNQLVCKHKRIRPGVESKMKQTQRVPNQVYEYLLQLFKGQRYIDDECHFCQNQIQKIKQRKIMQKQKIIKYEKLKTSLSVMISQAWIKKWMNFLYKKSDFAYFSKGYPMPGPIDNKALLEGQKCKKNLHKNEDYKVVSVFVWRFLKELYGGGPEIRYKWSKGEFNQFEEETIREIKVACRQIKDLFVINYVQSPKKSMIIEKTTSYVESVRGSEQGQDLSLPQQIIQ